MRILERIVKNSSPRPERNTVIREMSELIVPFTLVVLIGSVLFVELLVLLVEAVPLVLFVVLLVGIELIVVLGGEPEH